MFQFSVEIKTIIMVVTVVLAICLTAWGKDRFPIGYQVGLWLAAGIIFVRYVFNVMHPASPTNALLELLSILGVICIFGGLYYLQYHQVVNGTPIAPPAKEENHDEE